METYYVKGVLFLPNEIYSTLQYLITVNHSNEIYIAIAIKLNHLN